MKLKLLTLDGNHQFHYLTDKHKMLNVTVSVINFHQKFVQTTNFPIFNGNSFTKCLAFILTQKFYYT